MDEFMGMDTDFFQMSEEPEISNESYEAPQDVQGVEPYRDNIESQSYAEKNENVQSESQTEDNNVLSEISESTPNNMFEVPADFESQEDALKWYANRFEDMKERYNEIYNIDTTQYVEQKIREIDENVEGAKIVYEALKNNPKEFVLQYMPELLAEYGIMPVMSQEEILGNVQKQLAKEFGDDYEMRYNPQELINPLSYSTKMLMRQQALLQEYSELNEQNSKVFSEWNNNLAQGKSNLPNTPNQQDLQQIIDSNYPEFEKRGFSREDYDLFVQEASKKQLTMDDLHKVVYYDGYMRMAYEQGLNDGKKGIYNKMTKENNAERKLPDSVTKVMTNSRTEYPTGDFFSQVFDGNRIPNY